MLMLLSINDEVSSIYSQIVEKIEVVPEVVPQWWARDKETKENSFLEVKRLENGFTTKQNPGISYQLMDPVMK